VINHFSPKLSFSDHGMHARYISYVTDLNSLYNYRLLIAALHFNENYGREQAKTAAGAEQM